MTEAEIIEKINKKRNELEESRSANASADAIKAIEDEIEELLGNLSDQNPQTEEQVFFDECAG